MEKPAAEDARGLPEFAHLGRTGGRECNYRSGQGQEPTTAVFDGFRQIGWVTTKRTGFEARTSSGRSLGLFNTEAAAAMSLLGESLA
jgi:hypothetical protein